MLRALPSLECLKEAEDGELLQQSVKQEMSLPRYLEVQTPGTDEHLIKLLPRTVP